MGDSVERDFRIRGDVVGQMSRFTRLLTLAIALLLPVSFAYSQVSGDVSGRWTVGDSPIIVEGDITVPQGEMLEIDAGVTVTFNGPYAIYVKGVFQAQGEVQPDNAGIDWVTFTQDTSQFTGEDRWRGIRFDNSESGSFIEYCIIEHGYAHRVEGSTWADNNGGGLYINGASPRVTNSIIRNCKAEYSGGGVYIWLSSSHFRNNLIAFNEANRQGGGMFLDRVELDLKNLTVFRNDAGITLRTPNTTYGGGIYFGPNAYPVVRNSILWRNGDQTVNNPSDDVLIAGDNFYTAFIKFSIYSQVGSNVDNFVYQEDPDFVDEEMFHLELTSRGVDGGEYSDSRWQNEPRPNGGRINMGFWGGTVFATRSVPVAQAANPDIRFVGIRPGDSTAVRLASIRNVGNNDLIVQWSMVSMETTSLDPENEDTLPEDISRFTVAPFPEMTISPDSTKEFEVKYIVAPGQFATDKAYMLLDIPDGAIEYVVYGYPFDPQLQLSTTSINMDTLDLDEPASRNFTLRNLGNTNLVALTQPWMRTFSGNFDVPQPDGGEAARTILPGEELTLTVHYPPESESSFNSRPRDTGMIRDSIQVRTNDRTEFIQMRLVVIGPVLETEPAAEDTIDFQFVNLDSTRSLPIMITNGGNTGMHVDSIAFSSGAFSSNLPSGNNANVGVDDTLTVNITFSPSELRVYSDTLTVYSNTDEVMIYLKGRGTSGGVYFSGEIPSTFIPDTWGLGNDNVYICAGPTSIPAGKKLVIREGVQVMFEGNDGDTLYSLDVEGELEVLGSEDNPVTFSPLNRDQHPYFGGLRFIASNPNTRLEHAIVEYASTTELEAGSESLGLSPFGHGGGIAVYNTNPNFIDVTVRNCFSHTDGGGMWIYQSRPTLVRCIIEDNEATTKGGGLSLLGSSPFIFASTIQNNHATTNGGGIYFEYFSKPLISNTRIVNNNAVNRGGAVHVFGNSAPVLRNDVIFGNSADTDEGSAFFVSGNSNPIVRNSVVWSNDGTDIFVDRGSRLIGRYSDVEDADTYTNVDFNSTVVDVGPMFTDLVDFVPVDGSPLVDGGDPSAPNNDYSFPPSKGNFRNDIGLYGGPDAQYWGMSPVSMSIFENQATPRYLNFIINTTEPFTSNPQLEIEDYTGTETVTPIMLDADGVYQYAMEMTESNFLVLTVSGNTANTGDVRYRRSISVALLKPTAGGILAADDGSRLIFPPDATNKEVMFWAEQEHCLSIPEEYTIASQSDMNVQWTIHGQSESWTNSAELILPYDEDAVSNREVSGLSIWQLSDNGSWHQLESFVNTRSQTVHTQINETGTYAIFSGDGSVESILLPEQSALGVNYPNPFNPSTSIPFELSTPSTIELTLFNVLGQQVATISQGWFTSGRHVAFWNADDAYGNELTSGVYFYHLKTTPTDGSSGVVESRKLMLMR
ncbi:right-handed parallel beta-helix repeat-containing protein [bacterium]|nr:right-handed parallel beta-helix repeat-containing protein [bacterium]